MVSTPTIADRPPPPSPLAAGSSLGRPALKPRFLYGSRAFVPLMNLPKSAPGARHPRSLTALGRSPGNSFVASFTLSQSLVSNNNIDFLEI